MLESRDGDVAVARIYFKKAMQAAPEDLKVWHASATSEAHHGNMQGAREHFRRCLDIDEHNSFTLQVRISAFIPHLFMCIYIDLPRCCLRLNDDRLRLSVQAWGVAEAKAHNLAEARALFKQATLCDEKNAACWQAWGMMEQRAGKKNRARGLFKVRFSQVGWLQHSFVA